MAPVPTPLASAAVGDHRALAEGIAAHVSGLPHRPRLLALGEPLHEEDEFGRLRNALFVALVEHAGFTAVALETSAWHGRVVDAYVRGREGDEDRVIIAGFTHGFGAFAANRDLVRWMRTQNRHRAPGTRLRFAAFDTPTEMTEAPSPRPALEALHDFVATHVGGDLPPWNGVDRLLGPDEPWVEPHAATEPARSVGGEPRVAELRAVTDDLRRSLDGELPRLRRTTGADELDDALLAGRTAAHLLAYHAAMARDTADRWQVLATLRDTAMADNLQAIAERGRALVFAHNAHVRTGTVEVAFDPTSLRWQAAGAHLADRLGRDYHVIACALGDAPHHRIPRPEPGTVEGALYDALPPGNHLLSAAELRAVPHVPRATTNHRYSPVDATLLDEVDEVVFLRSVPPG